MSTGESVKKNMKELQDDWLLNNDKTILEEQKTAVTPIKDSYQNSNSSMTSLPTMGERKYLKQILGSNCSACDTVIDKNNVVIRDIELVSSNNKTIYCKECFPITNAFKKVIKDIGYTRYLLVKELDAEIANISTRNPLYFKMSSSEISVLRKPLKTRRKIILETPKNKPIPDIVIQDTNYYSSPFRTEEDFDF